MRYVLGIDLGGATILAGVIDRERGKVVATGKCTSRADEWGWWLRPYRAQRDRSPEVRGSSVLQGSYKLRALAART